MTGALIRRKAMCKQSRGKMATLETNMGVNSWKPKKAKNCPWHKPRERHETDFSPRGLKGAWPCQYLDFRFLASRTLKQYLSMFPATPFVVLRYVSHRKLTPSESWIMLTWNKQESSQMILCLWSYSLTERKAN